MSLHVIYHDNCYDGFACAYIARLVRPDCILHPMSYGLPMPIIPDEQEIWMLDFSIPRNDLIELCNRSKYVTVLDHHKSAQENLINWSTPHSDVKFDMNECGATLTYKHFVSSVVIPDFYQYIRDRDLWTFKLYESEKVSAYIASFERDFQVWDKLIRLFDVAQAIKEGGAILRFQNQKVAEICEHYTLINILGHEVPIVNKGAGGVFAYEIGSYLCETCVGLPFSVSYWDDLVNDRKVFSLRSKGEFDVSNIARAFGGGGHKNAAGFETGRNNWEETLRG